MDVYTDGSWNTATKEGAWSFCIENSLYFDSGYEPVTTGNIMELMGLVKAMEYALSVGCSDLTIHCDSSYAVHCLNTWWRLWERTNWVNSKGEQVQNRKLIEQALHLKISSGARIRKVKGHGGNHYNNVADYIAVATRLAKGKPNITISHATMAMQMKGKAKFRGVEAVKLIA